MSQICVINLSHPFTPEQTIQLQRLLGGTFTLRVAKVHLDMDKPFAEQMKAVFGSIELTPAEWRDYRIVLNLPGLSTAAVLAMLETQRRSGILPEFIRMKSVAGPAQTTFEPAEIISGESEPEKQETASAPKYPAGARVLAQREVLEFTSTNGRRTYTIVMEPGTAHREYESIWLVYGRAEKMGNTVVVTPADDYDTIVVADEYAGDYEIVRGGNDVILQEDLQSFKSLGIFRVKEGDIVRFFGYKRRSSNYYVIVDGLLTEPDPVELAKARAEYRRRFFAEQAKGSHFYRFKNSDKHVVIHYDYQVQSWVALNWNTNEVIRTLQPEEVVPFIESVDNILNWVHGI